jgi:serine phosphatase RsbU (regulator of sigma subunit)
MLYSHFLSVTAAIIFLSLILLSSTTLSLWHKYTHFTPAISEQFELQELSDQIIYFDEVLTMSARMRVLTNNLDWEARYNEFVEPLDLAIKKIIELAPEAYNTYAKQTDAANLKLVEMEIQAFQWMRENRQQEALTLLFGNQYLTQKQLYAESIRKTLALIKKKIQKHLNNYQSSLLLNSVFAVLNLLLLIIIWITLFQLMKSYWYERDKSQNALETAKHQLETKNILLGEKIHILKQAQKEIARLNDCLKSDNLRMNTELNINRRLQKMLLPRTEELKQIEELEVAVFLKPANEVGGDYYDVQQLNEKIQVSIGDVTGHGLESGVLSIMVQTAIRTLLAHHETNLLKILNTINQIIYENVQRMQSNKTLSLILLDYQKGRISFSGQHEEIILVRQGEIECIDTIDLGFPVGLEPSIAEFVFEKNIEIEKGDVIVLYTDGITEAENMNKEYYGAERLCQIISQSWQLPAEEIKHAIINDLSQFIGEKKIFDDITLVVLKQR